MGFRIQPKEPSLRQAPTEARRIRMTTHHPRYRMIPTLLHSKPNRLHGLWLHLAAVQLHRMRLQTPAAPE